MTENKPREEKNFHIPIRTDLIEIFANFLLSKSNFITFKDYFYLYEFFKLLDLKSYSGIINDIDLRYYLVFIKEYLIAVVREKKTNKAILLDDFLNGHKYKEYFKVIYDKREEISSTDLVNIRNFISDRLRYAFLFKNIDSLKQLILDVETSNFESLKALSTSYETEIGKHFRELSRTKARDEMEILDSDTSEEGLLTLSKSLIETLNTESYYLNTGYEKFNAQLNGGIPRGECTLFFAKTGGFKSGIFLNLVANIKKYNRRIETLDKTKRPLILYVSLENKQNITYSRFVKLVLNKGKKEIKDYNYSDLAREVKEELESGENVCKEAEIKFIYRKSKSISTDYLYTLVEDAENEGFEVVAMFVDYIDLLKSSSAKSNDEKRHEMSQVVRDLCDLSVIKQIAVVSGGQLNRKAYGNDKEKLDLHMIGESLAMAHHADNIFIQNRYYSKELEQFVMEFYNGKQRSNEGDNTNDLESMDGFVEMFYKNNSFKIIPSAFEQVINRPNLTRGSDKEGYKKFDKSTKASEESLKEDGWNIIKNTEEISHIKNKLDDF